MSREFSQDGPRGPKTFFWGPGGPPRAVQEASWGLLGSFRSAKSRARALGRDFRAENAPAEVPGTLENRAPVEAGAQFSENGVFAQGDRKGAPK